MHKTDWTLTGDRPIKELLIGKDLVYVFTSKLEHPCIVFIKELLNF